MGQFVPWAATLGAPEYQSIVRNVLPALVDRKKVRPEPTNYVLSRWTASLDQEIKSIGTRLLRALFLVEQGCLVQGGIIFVVLLVLWMLMRGGR